MNIKRTEFHEWVRLDDKGSVFVGISDRAQKEFGEIVYLELPRLGAKVKKGEEIVVLESTKAAIDLYAPFNGTISRVNERFKLAPKELNEVEEEERWLYQLHLNSLEEWFSL